MKDFLKSAEEQLKSAEDKESVMRELSDHLETKKEYFESIGYSKDASKEKANEAMGSGEIIGQRLNEIHRPDGKKSKAVKIAVICVNLLFLFLIAVPLSKNSFIFPFAAAVIIFICNLFYSARAIRLKSVFISSELIIISISVMWISTPELTYPICNMILNGSSGESAESIYRGVRIALTVALNALIFLPNLYNIYHCVQIKRLKNTKRQNKTAHALIYCCIVFSVITAALSVPSFLMNERFCEKQEIIRGELMELAYESEEKYNNGGRKELEMYIENSGYNFIKNTNYTMTEIGKVAHNVYTYYKGNWCLELTIVEGRGYCHIVVTPRVTNRSQKYLFVPYEKENAVLEDLGDDELNGKYGSSIGKTREEIREIMNEHTFTSLTITKLTDSTESYYFYPYYSRDESKFDINKHYHVTNGYSFDFDSNGICYSYKHL